MELIDLKRGQEQHIVPAKIEALMSGVNYITIEKGKDRRLVTNHYTDGTADSAFINTEEILKTDNFFTLVRIVQEQAEKQLKEISDKDIKDLNIPKGLF